MCTIQFFACLLTKNRFEELEVEDLEESTTKFTETLRECARAVAGKTVKQNIKQVTVKQTAYRTGKQWDSRKQR